MTLPTLPGCNPQKKQTLPLPEISMKHVLVEGLKISYTEMGRGTPIVLVHGIPTSSYLWRNMTPKLSLYGKVICIDLPGFGFSDPPANDDYSVSNFAELLKGFLETVSVKNAVFICHDFGGPIVISYLLKNSVKPRKLIILNTFLHDDLPPYPISMKLARIRPLGEILMTLFGESIIRSGLEGGVINKSLISDEMVTKYYMPEGNPGKLRKSMLATLRLDYADDLKYIEQRLTTIDTPTLILWAENDTYLPLYLGKKIHRDIPGSKFITLSHCGHFLQEEKPENVSAIVTEFLNE